MTMNQTATSPTIRVQTNTNRLIANLGVVFSSADKVIAEIMQNARRAKATFVTFSQEGPVLVVQDNGIGIDDMQDLLHIAESGWDEETKARENSFGMGWLSTLFAADKVRVESKGKLIDFDSQSAIDGEEIPVREDCIHEGTRITLSGFKLQCQNTFAAIKKYAKGFPIRVYFNGEEIARPDALENLKTVETEVGYLQLAGMHTEKEAADRSYSLYFQGLPVGAGYGYNGDGGNIVHLDNSFKVKMPDRDAVIDPEDARRKISAAAKQLWKGHLEELKKVLNPEDFVGYWPAITKFELEEVLNDVPVLPPKCFVVVVEDPHQRANDTPMFHHKHMVYQSDVESGKVVVVSDSRIAINSFDGQGFAALKIGYDNDWLFLDEALEEDHWIFKHVLDIDKVGIKVDYTGLQRKPYGCVWPEGEIVLTENYTIKVGKHSIVVEDWALVLNDETAPSYEERRIVIVPHASSGGEAAYQISDFMDDSDSYRDDWATDAADNIKSQVAVMRGEPAKVTIRKILEAESVAYRNHCLQAAVVSVVKERKIESYDLIDLLQQFGAELGTEGGNVDQAAIQGKASAFIGKLLAESKSD
jgi:hypothetical protein